MNKKQAKAKAYHITQGLIKDWLDLDTHATDTTPEPDRKKIEEAMRVLAAEMQSRHEKLK